MATVRIDHTADLTRTALNESRALLYEVFDDMTESDWDHCLGGMHATVWEDDLLLGHASVVQRRLLHRGEALRAGSVEGVAVRAPRRGEGHGATLMAAIEGIILRAYVVGVLGSTDEARGFYAARGWLPWQGPLSALTPAGIVPTPDDRGGTFVLPVSAELDIDGELTCDWRDGDTW